MTKIDQKVGSIHRNSHYILCSVEVDIMHTSREKLLQNLQKVQLEIASF